MSSRDPSEQQPANPPRAAIDALRRWSASPLPELLALLALWALESRLLQIWLLLDTRPPRWDESLFLQATNAWSEFWSGPSFESLSTAATTGVAKAPPFWTALMGAVQALRGSDTDELVWISNSLALLLLMLATYMLGRRLFGRFTATIAAALVTLFSGVVLLTRLYLLDVQYAAVVTLAVFGLARLTRRRNRRRDLALATALIALACFTRWQSVLYLWLPVLYVAGRAWRQERRSGASSATTLRRLGIPVILLGLSVAVVLAPFALANLTALREVAARNAGPTANPTRYDFGWYLTTWPELELLDQLLLLALIGVGIVVALWKFRLAAVLLLSWIASGYLVLSILPKDPRYDMPMMPALALLACAPWRQFPGGVDRGCSGRRSAC